jgi:hypothetical protein
MARFLAPAEIEEKDSLLDGVNINKNRKGPFYIEKGAEAS